MTPQERDESMRAMVGRTWEEIAEEHDMRCGACRGGMLTLENVTAIYQRYMAQWTLESVEWTPAFNPWRKTVTLTLVCDQCGATMKMPIHAKETTQP